jgi:hypothetical protein
VVSWLEVGSPGAGDMVALDRPPLLLVSGADGVWRPGGGVEAPREEQGMARTSGWRWQARGGRPRPW